jgi:hypothetical protein
LKRKRAAIMQAALEPGSSSWDDILEMTWEEINERARNRETGFKTFKKLLGKAEYDR